MSRANTSNQPANLPHQQPQTDAIAKVNIEDTTNKLQQISETYGPTALASLTQIGRSLKMAEGLQMTRAVVRQAMPLVRELAGTKLGFRTDKDDKGGYNDNDLVECLTEAALRGVSWVGNEFNIICRSVYITKEGYSRLVCEVAGIADYNTEAGVPKMAEGGATVPMKASWKLNGTAQSLEALIPVRLNSGMGADAAIGKATRKMHCRVHYKLTASPQSAFDADNDPTEAELAIASTSTTELADKLKNVGKDGPRVADAVIVETVKKDETKAPVAETKPPVTETKAGEVEHPKSPEAPKRAKGTVIPFSFVEIAFSEFEAVGGNVADYLSSQGIDYEALENGDGPLRKKHIEQLGSLTAERKAAAPKDGKLPGMDDAGGKPD